MNKKTIGLVLILFFLFNSTNAELIFKQNEKIDLKIPCLINNTYCGNSTICNITIFSPINQSTIVNNAKMTWNPSFYNYTLTSQQIFEIGEYSYVMVCPDDFSIIDTFKITQNGKADPPANLIIFFFIAFIAILAGWIYLICYTIKVAASFKMEITDFGYNLILYAILLIFYGFNEWYFENLMIARLLLIFISVGTFGNVIIPGYLLYASFLKKTLMSIRGEL